MRPERYLVIIAAGLLASVTAEAQQKPPSKQSASASTCGPLSGQIFRCPKFGFSYRVPFGWVDRTAEMQLDPAHAPGSAESESRVPTDQPRTSAKSETLLAVFARPPFAPGETVDSAVVVASEALASYPAVKTAADYFGPIAEIAEQRGFNIAEEPYDFTVGNKRLVRGDFTNPAGKLTIWQTCLVIIERGQIVSFTFLGGSEDEVEELIANLSFAAPKPGSHG